MMIFANRLILFTSDFIRLLLKWVDTPRLQCVYNQLEPKVGYNTDITGIKKITRWKGSYWHWADEINASFELGFIPYRVYQEHGKPPYMPIHTINDYVYVYHSGVQDVTWLKIEDESSGTHLVYYAKRGSDIFALRRDTGPARPQGLKGETGSIGPTGGRGKIGPQGKIGPKGETGSRGPTGESGKTGPERKHVLKADTGPKGESATGESGKTGPEGKQGLKGDTGTKGETGSRGPTGEVGKTGPEGKQGLMGDTGEKGSKGAVGPGGAVGPVGARGEKGEKGDVGGIGPAGPRGSTGLRGARGVEGVRGVAGRGGPIGPLVLKVLLEIQVIVVKEGIVVNEEKRVRNVILQMFLVQWLLIYQFN